MKAVLLISFLSSLSLFAQTKYVFTDQPNKDWVTKYTGADSIIYLDSSNVDTINMPNHIVFGYGKQAEFDFLNSRPKFCESIKSIQVIYTVPYNLHLFKNLKVLDRHPEIEHCFCYGPGHHYVFLMDSTILNLKKLKRVYLVNEYDDLSGIPHIYERFASLPKLREFEVYRQYYPFSVLTNESIKKIGAPESYPEIELFWQLGYYKIPKYESSFVGRLIKDRGLPLTPPSELKTHKLKNGSLNLYYKNGQRLVSGTVENGKLEGEWNLWFADGKLAETRYYENNTPVGNWTFYHEITGDTLYSVQYKNGNIIKMIEMHGRPDQFFSIQTSTNYDQYDQRKIHWISRSSEFGMITEEQRRSIGDSVVFYQKHVYNDSVLVKTIEYVGCLNKKEPSYRETTYYINGQIAGEYEYIEYPSYTPHGTRRKWDKSGIIILEEEYRYGEKIE